MRSSLVPNPRKNSLRSLIWLRAEKGRKDVTTQAHLIQQYSLSVLFANCHDRHHYGN